MSSSHAQTHQDRINTEMELLRRLESENLGDLKIEHQNPDSVTLRLIVGGYVVRKAQSSQLDTASEHRVHIRFLDSDEYSITFSVQLDPILFHPNIPPNGQCEVKFSHIVDYLYTLWDFYTYKRVDKSADHIYNQRALNWYETEKPDPPSQKVLHRIVSNEQEPAARALTPSEQVAQRPVEVASSDGRRQSSGFRVKGRIRVPQPLQLRFPWENWENGTRANYERWWYDVPHSHQIAQNPGHLKVIILEKALRSILHHASGDTRNERVGILVGSLYQDLQSNEKWVEIVSMLPAERVRANIASVEVSMDEINRLNESVDVIIAETRETVRKIGWYHTHPGHGIFMSSTDQSNQRLCYGADWQVAIVVDPIRKHYGAFHSSECNPLFDGLLVFSDQEAQHLQTPAYLAWRDLEERRIVSNRLEQPPRESDAVVPRPAIQQRPVRIEVQANIPPRQTDLIQQEAVSLLAHSNEQPVTTPPPHLSEQDEQPVQQPQQSQEQKGKNLLRQIGSVGEKILKDIGKNGFMLPLLLLVTLGLIFGLIFTIIRSNGTLANVQSQSGKQVKTIQLQLQKVQKQLDDQKQENQKLQMQVQGIQQDLFNQISDSDLKNTDPLMYRNLLKTIVGINPSTDSRQKATDALKEPVVYITVQGDTLEIIAKKFGVSVKALRDANPIVNSAVLPQNTALKIPGITV